MIIKTINGTFVEATVFREQLLVLLQELLDKTNGFHQDIDLSADQTLAATPMKNPTEILDEHLAEEGQIVICYSESDLFGFALVKYEETCYINKLVVSKRGQGIGSKILEKIKENCLTFGSTSITLDVHSTNYDAIEFYKKNNMVVLAHKMILEI